MAAHKKKSKKKKIRDIISVVFSFLLTLIFFGMFACSALFFGAFNNKTVLNIINKSNYYNNVYEELYENVKTITDSAGLPESTIKDVITLKRVYVNGKQYIASALEGKKAEANTENVGKELQTNINNYLADKNVETQDMITVNPGTSQIVYQIQKEYKRMIEFPFVKYIQLYETQFRSVASWVFGIGIVGLIIIEIVLFKIHRYKHRIARYTAFGVLGATWMTLAVPTYLMISGWIKQWSITPKYYADFITEYFNNSGNMFFYVAGVGALLTGALIFLATYIKNNVSVKRSSQHRHNRKS